VAISCGTIHFTPAFVDTQTQLELYNQASNIVRAKYSEIKDQAHAIGAFRSSALEDGKLGQFFRRSRFCPHTLYVCSGKAAEGQLTQLAELEQAVFALERAAADMDKQTRQVESLALSLPLGLLHEQQQATAPPAPPLGAAPKDAPATQTANEA
jgi:hypothetical protein